MMDAFDRAAEREARARRERRARPVWKHFLLHLRIYIAVNAVLVTLWALASLVTTPDPLWFLDSLFGWGIGVGIHYIMVTQITKQWRARRRPAVASKPGDQR